MGARMRVRHANWPELLADFIASRATIPFAWGSQDCCLFAADAVAVITGVELAARWRDQYADARSAARLLKEGGGVAAIAQDALGGAIAPLTARRGDVLALDAGNGPSLGVCVGSMVAVPGFAGLVYFPLTAATTAWRV